MSSESKTDQARALPGAAPAPLAGPPLAPPPWKRLVRAAGYAVALALLAYLAAVALRNWRAVSQYGWRAEPALLVCSCICLLAGRLLLPVGVRWVLRLFGKDASLGLCWQAYALSQFAKYVPGGVWLFLARAYLYSRYGLARATSAVLIAVEQALFIAAGLVVLLATLPWLPGLAWSAWLWVSAAALAVLLAALHPRVISWAYGLVRKLDGDAAEARVSYRGVLRVLLLFVGFWALSGFAFALLVSALTGLPAELWPAAAGMFAGACSVGFLVVVAPAGLGVREAGLAAFLSLLYPLPVAAALALAGRFWWLMVDIAFCAGSAGGLSLLGQRGRLVTPPGAQGLEGPGIALRNGG